MRWLSPLLVLLLAPTFASASTLDTLGFLPGGTFSGARGVSGDGSVVVGIGADGAGVVQAWRYTQGGGYQVLFSATNPTFGATAFGVTDDGTQIVGSDGGSVYRWTQGGGKQVLFGNPGEATAISDSGTIVVGNLYTGSAFFYNPTGPSGIGGGGAYSDFISFDGVTMLGGTSNGGGGFEAFSWAVGTGQILFGDLAGGAVDSGFNGGSADSSIGVGYGTDAVGKVATRYDGGWASLGRLEAGFDSEAFSANGDASIVVGNAGTSAGNRAFVWDAVNGMRDLNTVLAAQGVNLNGFVLTDVRKISRDGTTIVGQGLNSGGQTEAFVIRDFSLATPTVPEPSTWLLALFGGLLLVRRAR